MIRILTVVCIFILAQGTWASKDFREGDLEESLDKLKSQTNRYLELPEFEDLLQREGFVDDLTVMLKNSREAATAFLEGLSKELGSDSGSQKLYTFQALYCEAKEKDQTVKAQYERARSVLMGEVILERSAVIPAGFLYTLWQETLTENPNQIDTRQWLKNLLLKGMKKAFLEYSEAIYAVLAAPQGQGFTFEESKNVAYSRFKKMYNYHETLSGPQFPSLKPHWTELETYHKETNKLLLLAMTHSQQAEKLTQQAACLWVPYAHYFTYKLLRSGWTPSDVQVHFPEIKGWLTAVRARYPLEKDKPQIGMNHFLRTYFQKRHEAREDQGTHDPDRQFGGLLDYPAFNKDSVVAKLTHYKATLRADIEAMKKDLQLKKTSYIRNLGTVNQEREERFFKEERTSFLEEFTKEKTDFLKELENPEVFEVNGPEKRIESIKSVSSTMLAFQIALETFLETQQPQMLMSEEKISNHTELAPSFLNVASSRTLFYRLFDAQYFISDSVIAAYNTLDRENPFIKPLEDLWSSSHDDRHGLPALARESVSLVLEALLLHCLLAEKILKENIQFIKNRGSTEETF